jgi:hypothetical protein
MLDILLTAAGIFIIAAVLWDAFETVVLPRRITRRIRITRLFYRYSWLPYRSVARGIRNESSREAYLGFYGPLSLILLLIVWAVLLVFGFAIIHASTGSLLDPDGAKAGFWTDVYMSASSFFTLGLGDVRPDSTVSHIVTVVEAGHGFAFLALVISYLPILYQSFSRRETAVSLLDSRAGSPPSAGEFFIRLGDGRRNKLLPEVLEDWERWSADLLESHLSYPVLSLYRSQHERQSWLAALTMILDVSALVLVDFHDETTKESAQLTFAMSRHAAVDIAQIFNAHPREDYPDRLPDQDYRRLTDILERAHLDSSENATQLLELRKEYEPYVFALSSYLLMPLPSWLPGETKDAWQSSAWE